MNDKYAINKLAEMGLFCGGCPMAQLETIEEGARVHGIDSKKLIKELNLRNQGSLRSSPRNIAKSKNQTKKSKEKIKNKRKRK